jgi:hypothetical protein
MPKGTMPMKRIALWMAVPTLALAVAASAASKKHDPGRLYNRSEGVPT